MAFPFDEYTFRLDEHIQNWVQDWLVPNFRGFFQNIKEPIDFSVGKIDDLLAWLPPLVLIGIIAIIAWRASGWRMALFSAATLLFVGFLGLWAPTITTLSMILTALVFCILLGVPLGIIAARSDTFEAIIRPILDTMQTIPAFVYLVPIVMLFSVGTVPGVIATIIFALPPIIRLTNLGIRQVNRELVEAAYAFGSTPMQVLREVQFPLALRTIMAGLNQTLMLALSMVVIVALIGGGGLGLTVWTGLGRNDVGFASIGGIGIVVLAIILDRITQGLGRPTPPGKRTVLWYLQTAGVRLRAFARRKGGDIPA